jgi:hypothetical protein
MLPPSRSNQPAPRGESGRGSERRDGLFQKPQFFSDAVAIGDVHGQYFHELFQLPRGRVGVVACALQLGHKVALVGYVALNFSELPLGSRQMILKQLPVHETR